MSKLNDMEKMGNRRQFLTAIGATSFAALAGCLGDDDDDDTDDDNGEDEPEIESLEIDVGDTTLDVDQAESFTVTAEYEDDRFEDVTDDAEITVEDEAIATVANEEITADDHGETILSAEYEGVEEELTIEVPIQAESIEVDIEDTTVASGTTQEFTVTAELSNDRFEEVTDEVDVTVEEDDIIEVGDGEIEGSNPGETTLSLEYEEFDEVLTITVPVESLDEGDEVFDGLFDPGFINEVFEDGGITFRDGTEYPGRFVSAESNGETIELEAVAPFDFEEEGGEEDRFALANSINAGFFTDDPDQLEDEFTYEEFDISVEKVDGEDLGEAVVRTDWYIESLEEDDFELFFNRINEENE